MARTISLRGSRVLAAAFAVLLLALVVPIGVARADVIQLVTTSFVPGASGTPASHSDEVFVPTSADVTTNTLAAIGGAPPGGPGYVATASAGVFGDVGLDLRTFGVSPGSLLFAEVLIGSDEFVNVLGVPASVQSSFVIDGGFINDLFSTNTTVTFVVEVGAENRGQAGPETDRVHMEIAARLAADFGGAGGFFPGFEGGSYTLLYTTDATGAPSVSTFIEGGLDLGATLHPVTGLVEIPLSFQTLDLGTLQPGERLLLAYRVEIAITQNGIAEGIFAGFSDPFDLGTRSILTSLSFRPLDDGSPGTLTSPGTLPLLAIGLLLLLGREVKHRR